MEIRMKVKFPGFIEDLILALKNIKDSNAESVKNIARSINYSVDELEKFSTFDHAEHESYGRKLIYINDRFKIIMMSWAPGDFTAIHDHGNVDWGCIIPMENLNQRNYLFHKDELILESASDYHAMEPYELGGKLIHFMGNLSNSNKMSIHIYGINSANQAQTISEGSRVFSPENNCTYYTDGPAYLLLPEDLIRKKAQLPKINTDALNDYFELLKQRNILKNNQTTGII